MLIFSSSFAEESSTKRPSRRGEVAGYASRDATVLSVMGWGVALAVGIATLAALLSDGDNAHSH